ncbi:MAG: hypothetical protein MJE77_30105 [Proteobacteria bacterium]|nr:hypothetical protein [Pseudomonadota bacterium]
MMTRFADSCYVLFMVSKVREECDASLYGRDIREPGLFTMSRIGFITPCKCGITRERSRGCAL